MWFQILTLGLAVPGGFDKVFDTFTYMRLKLGESVKFKLLISMLSSRGSGHVIFQVSQTGVVHSFQVGHTAEQLPTRPILANCPSPTLVSQSFFLSMVLSS